MKSDNPVLVIFIPGFPRDEDDNTCLPAQQAFIKSINKMFPFITIIIFGFQYPFTRAEYQWNNNRVIAFGGKNKGGLSRIFLWRQVQKKMAEIMKQNKVAGLLSFWCGECALIGKRVAQKNNIPHYCWIMGQDAKKQNHYVKRIKPEAAELIAISDFIAGEFNSNHAITPQQVIPIGIDAKEFKGQSKLRDIDILGTGSLIPLKQYDIFISIVKEIKAFFPEIKACIVGKGPEKFRLHSMIKESGVEDNIELMGEQLHPQVLQLMMRSKIFLHPSLYEGFSGVCLEALYAGTKVISFCQPMKQEITNWHIVNSKEAMQEKVLLLLNSSLSYDPALPYPIEETTKSVMKLFGF